MHFNFGVINNKLNSALATDQSKYTIALSYAKCDSAYEFCHKSNQTGSVDGNSLDDGHKETTLEKTGNDVYGKLSIKDKFGQSKRIPEDGDLKSYAIRVHNLNFAYKKFILGKKRTNKVLEKCSVRVIKGNIYALLGSSGCGKTTLLKCILGRLQPSSGEVRVFGVKPQTPESTVPGPGVGYMPQELALFGEISIEETLLYFGRLYNMNETEINNKINFLIEVLSLPPKTRPIKQLSGGQQKRVSLLAALIHCPQLLILDEPTVGVDPLLRQRIWLYLEQLCREQGTTIIITTHYIEEARGSETVGLMRGGRLLAEENPEVLIKKYNTRSLEEVFLKLCQINDSEETQEVEVYSKDCNNNNTNQTPSDEFVYSETDRKNRKELYNSRDFSYFFSWFRVWAIFLRIWNKIKGNPILFVAYLLPSLQLSFFCLSVGKDPRALNIAIHNGESPPIITQSLLDSLDNHTIIQSKHKTVESAINSVIDGKAWTAISLSSNFSKCLKLRIRKGGDAKNNVIECSNVKLYPDMSNAVISINLIKSIGQSFINFVQNYLTKLGYNPNTVTLPIQPQEVIYGTINPSVQDFMAPGMVIALIFFAPFALAALTLIDEHESGLLERSLIAGVKPLEILFAHLIMQLCILTIEVLLMIFTTFYIWQIPNHGALWEVTAIVYLQGVSGITLGLFIASILPDKIYAFVIGMGVIFPTWVTCGVFWPIESMPQLMKFISYFLPLTCPIESMRYIAFRGWNLTYFPVILGFISSFAYIFMFFTGAVIVFKWFI